MDSSLFLQMYPEFAGFSATDITAKIARATRYLGNAESWGSDYLEAFALVVAHLLTVGFEDTARMAAISQQAAVGKVTPPQPLTSNDKDAYWKRSSWGLQFLEMRASVYTGLGIMAIY